MGSARRTNPWASLSALCVGFFLIMMDTTIVNVALPRMMAELDAGLHQITWVNSAYLLTFAAPLLVAGRLGDRWGRKPVFLGGMAVFTAASLWCGWCDSVEMLIAARALQGVGAAVMMPQPMAFITTLFPARRRGAALGVWGSVAGAATTVGPLLGGFLADGPGWPWIFLVNVPIGLLGLAMTGFLVPGVRPRGGRRFDLAGTLLSALGLLALVFGVHNGEYYGWGRVLGPVGIAHIIGVGVLLLGVFVVWQRYNDREPLMPLTLFGNRDFGAATVTAAAIGFSLTGLYLPLTLLLQEVLELAPRQAGALMLPIAVANSVAGPVAGALSDRIGGRRVVMTGLLVFAAGIGAIAVSAGPETDPWLVAAALAVCGIGTGAAFAPMANVAVGGLSPELVGAASGVYNAVRQVAGVLGSAAVSVSLQAWPADGASQHGMASAVGATLLLLVVVLFVGSAACLAMEPRPRPAESFDAPRKAAAV
ncbi:DHA2 family efflux MFS transporter permease subunit [Thermobifida halotolerans]|uniref:DHA2 family efflux MFS transporter permease subunit n=1 Tax=Thermobifida halotolerans TaxID=483545 RepID=A0AA97M5S3_9ACTN|nr:DHA2 family efflux MFS transporter permease subunit [Thermobifida halotolerans]UOE21272.1 DHA2 family efflux MFS transporter permease subunit [Thermobifida halotolerans]